MQPGCIRLQLERSRTCCDLVRGRGRGMVRGRVRLRGRVGARLGLEEAHRVGELGDLVELHLVRVRARARARVRVRVRKRVRARDRVCS